MKEFKDIFDYYNGSDPYNPSLPKTLKMMT
jgi:hypothetical protein